MLPHALYGRHDWKSALRAILSFMANTRYVAYLDDDNTWFANQLKSSLLAVFSAGEPASRMAWS